MNVTKTHWIITLIMIIAFLLSGIYTSDAQNKRLKEINDCYHLKAQYKRNSNTPTKIHLIPTAREIATCNNHDLVINPYSIDW